MSGIAGMPEFAGHEQWARREPTERDRVVRSIVLGGVSALLGAAVWVAIGAATRHQVGFVAVGVGLLVGYSMSRLRASWPGLPFVAAAIALVGVLVGDLVLDVFLQAQYEGVGVGAALGTTITTPSVARELFGAYFSPIDLVFWLVAAWAAYRAVSASVVAARAGLTPAG